MPGSKGETEQLQSRIQDLEAEIAMLRQRPDPRHSSACELDSRMTQQSLDKATPMASVGAWAVEVPSGKLTWSDEVFRIHELPLGEPPSVDEAVAFYAPEARAAVEDGLQRLLATGEPYDLELPLVTAKGNRIWVRGIGDVERDSNGDPMRLYGMFEDITAQVTQANERDRAREEAESAARVKSELLATMSHEIRTPLNGILGMAQVIEQTELTNEQRDYIGAIRTSGSSLLVLLNDLLDLSKIEAGRLKLETQAFDMDALLRGSIDMLRTQYSGRDTVELRIDIDEQIAGAWIGDPVRVRQVILNLLGNGLKFTDSGYVELRAHVVSQDCIRVEVEDTGIGIAPDLHEHLFEVFEQADASTTRRVGGTGLGLAICRRLVDQMGGRIGMESEPGNGSRFWFELPIERAAADTPVGTDFRTAANPGAPVALSGSSKAPRVLVVEDNPVNQVVARKLVEGLGCEVTLASNGEEGVEVAMAAEFDLILMDCQMPVLDGYGATRRLRRLEAAAGRAYVPVIAMTANALDGDREICLDAGMDDYIAKPVDRVQLAHFLQSWVERPTRSVA